MRGNFTESIIECFITAKANAFENLLEPLQKLLRLCPPIAQSLGQPEFFKRILQKLGSNKALTRLNLLRIVQSVCDASEEQGALINQYGLYETIQRLAETDSAILVRDMATKLTRACDDHEALIRSGGKRRGVRRTSTSTTPPGMSSSQSMPPTPTSSRSSHSTSYFGDHPDRRSIVNGPVPFRARGVGNSNGITGTSNAEDTGSVNSAQGLTNGSSSSANKSRLTRTTMVRNSRQSILYGTPKREDASSPTPRLGSPAQAPVMLATSRRRRQTSGGESRWS